MRLFENLNVDFLSKRRLFYGLSAAIFLIGLISIVFRGLIFGIDFKGGSEIVLQFEQPVDIAEVRGYVENIGLGNVEVKTFGGETGILIRTELQAIPEEIYPRVLESINNIIETRFPGLPVQIIDSTRTSVTYQLPNPDTTNILVNVLNEAAVETEEVSAEPGNTQILVSVGIADWIKENLRERMPDNPFTVLKEESVGPKIGAELKENAVVAVLFSLLVILVYLGFRFKFIFAAAAVIALFHDVLITLGIFALLYNVIPGLNFEIDLTVVAAFLTLVGYSINDTVVVFDRVRENMKIHKTMPVKDLINDSINKTMSRTIITSGTTLLTILVLLFFGGEVLRTFAFTLGFGIIIGTYSSIFVASALVLEYANRGKKKLQF